MEYRVYSSNTWESEEKLVTLYTNFVEDYSDQRIHKKEVIKV